MPLAKAKCKQPFPRAKVKGKQPRLGFEFRFLILFVKTITNYTKCTCNYLCMLWLVCIISNWKINLNLEWKESPQGIVANMQDCKNVLNYHDQKIQQTLTHNTWKHKTAVSTLLGLIRSVYCDLHHWRSNQRPQIAVPKLYNWATSSYCTEVTPN